jgi:hypothetical protein
MVPEAWASVAVFVLFPLIFICRRCCTPTHFRKKEEDPATNEVRDHLPTSIITISVKHNDNILTDDVDDLVLVGNCEKELVVDYQIIPTEDCDVHLEPEVSKVLMVDHQTDPTEYCDAPEVSKVFMVDATEDCDTPLELEVSKVPMVDHQIDLTEDWYAHLEPEVSRVLMVDPTEDCNAPLAPEVSKVPMVDHQIDLMEDCGVHLEAGNSRVLTVDYQIDRDGKCSGGDYTSAHNEHGNGLSYYPLLLWTQILYLANLLGWK